MEEYFVRKIFYYKSYYLDFFGTLKDDVKKKFDWTLKLIATLDRVPAKYLDTSRIQLDYMRFVLSQREIFSESSVSLIKGK